MTIERISQYLIGSGAVVFILALILAVIKGKSEGRQD
jgi:hypothetical protein